VFSLLLSGPHALRPERFASVTVSARWHDYFDNYHERWGVMNNALAAVATQLRPSLRLHFEDICPTDFEDAEEGATLLTLLNRHAAQVKIIDLSLHFYPGDLESVKDYLQKRADGDLLFPSNAFLPAVRSVKFYLYENIPDDLLSSVPSFRDSIEEVTMTALYYRTGVLAQLGAASSRVLRTSAA
jgi:hypothetical protein